MKFSPVTKRFHIQKEKSSPEWQEELDEKKKFDPTILDSSSTSMWRSEPDQKLARCSWIMQRSAEWRWWPGGNPLMVWVKFCWCQPDGHYFDWASYRRLQQTGTLQQNHPNPSLSKSEVLEHLASGKPICSSNMSVIMLCQVSASESLM